MTKWQLLTIFIYTDCWGGYTVNMTYINEDGEERVKEKEFDTLKKARNYSEKVGQKNGIKPEKKVVRY